MPFPGLFEWMDALPSSVALRESLKRLSNPPDAPRGQHAAFAGLIAIWDLRLVGIAYRSVPVSKISGRVFPWMFVGFFVSVVTGFLLAYSKPMTYFPNFYFWLKNGLMVLAGLNAAVFHLTTEKTVKQWENDLIPPPAARFVGVASLVMWSAIIITGRMIAYSALVPQWWLDFTAN